MIPDKKSMEYKIRKFRQSVIRENAGTDKAQFKLENALLVEAQENRKKRDSEQNEIKMGLQKHRDKIVIARKIREQKAILAALEKKAAMY